MMKRLADISGLVRLLAAPAKPRLRCSFCRKDADQVGRLVAGPSVYICDECIMTCVAVLEQHGGLPPSPPADHNRPTHA
jgi:ATP-dependent Clp protease ATP-binding subunit ClpX